MDKEKYMSGSEIRQLVHISTRKMKYLMEHDYVPHINTGGTTHKYLILRTDAEAFLLRTVNDPSFLAELSGMFTSRKEHHPKPIFEVTDMNVAAFHDRLLRLRRKTVPSDRRILPGSDPRFQETSVPRA